MQRLPFILTYALIAAVLIIFLLVGIPRILFPYEVQCLEGAMLTEISWILKGNLLYCPPTIYHVPSLYQPLYFYITAGITSITGLSFETARITSILATIATTALLYFTVTKETGKSFFGIAAVGLYLSAFAKTEFSFIVARIDPLFTALLVAAVVVIYYSRSYQTLLLGALLFSLSFFTKQSALIFIPSVILYLLYARSLRQALVFTTCFLMMVAAGILLLNAYYDGWYSFYAFSIIQSMSGLARWRYAIDGLFLYIIIRCWLLSILLLFFPVRSIFVRDRQNKDTPVLYFGLFFATAIGAGFIGILNSGGGHNVLLQAAAGCGFFLPIITSDLWKNKQLGKFAPWFIFIQLGFLISNPWRDPRNIVTDADKKNVEEFFHYAAALPGEIWIPLHGSTQQYTGKRDYAGFDCIQGAVLPKDERAIRLRMQLDSALADHHWSFILTDIVHPYPHYRLSDSIRNLNKVQFNDDNLLYIYTPSR